MDKSAQTASPDGSRSPGPRLRKSFFARSVHEVAPDLIGATFLVNGVGGIIVEVEAYDQTDPAAHSFRGPTPRNAVMFGPPGVNFVCQAAGSAAGVLLRAIEPTHGLAAMRQRRGVTDAKALCSGPGKLCEALAITKALGELPIDRSPIDVARPQRRSRNRDRSQDRPDESRRSALALRTEGLEVPEQAF